MSDNFIHLPEEITAGQLGEIFLDLAEPPKARSFELHDIVKVVGKDTEYIIVDFSPLGFVGNMWTLKRGMGGTIYGPSHNIEFVRKPTSEDLKVLDEDRELYC